MARRGVADNQGVIRVNMDAFPFRPKVHFMVCTHRRPADSPLGPGCADAGARVLDELKEKVADARAYSTVWVTETQCLGVCPKEGAAVACYPSGELWSAVQAEDASTLFEKATASMEKQR